MGVTEMKCPACGAPLKFSAASGKVECEYCGTTFNVEDLITPVKEEQKEKPQTEAEKDQAGAKKPAGQNLYSYDWGDYRKNLHFETLEGAKCYVCKSCGAELVTTDTTASLKCPYCDNEIVLDDRLSGSIRPQGIIPFKIDPKQPEAILKKFYDKAPLLPRDFLDAHRISEMQGVYVPYWLFSGTVDADLMIEATRVRHFRQGDYDVTESSYFDVIRAGDLGFQNVPVDAHTKVDNLLTESLEPYDFRELREFQTPYLAGYVTDRFDADPETCLPRAEQRMFESTKTAFLRTVTGYETTKIRGGKFDMQNTRMQYVLLPAYFIKGQYKGKEYRIGINGQTGKIIGELPIDKKRQKQAFWIPFAAAAAVVLAIVLPML